LGFYARSDYRQCRRYRQRRGGIRVRLVHMTDPHLSSLDNVSISSLLGKRLSGYLSWKKNRSKHYLPAVLERLESAVRAEDPDQVLLTGDLVQIGLEHEIRQAADWMTALARPEKVMLVPGNHDVYAGGSAAMVSRFWSNYLFQPASSAAGGDLTDRYPVLRRFGKIDLIGLSTACVTPVFMATGRLGRAQLDRLGTLLHGSAAEGQLVVLLIHHPPLPGLCSRRKALTDDDALEGILRRYPPAMVFYGHLHRNHELQLGDTRIYCTASASSVSDASYRVVDIGEMGDGWTIRMRLKTLDVGDGGEPVFVTTDDQSWETGKTI
jgi:3',5'-cyclic AMP phosphodiesterase CpdA